MDYRRRVESWRFSHRGGITKGQTGSNRESEVLAESFSVMTSDAPPELKNSEPINKGLNNDLKILHKPANSCNRNRDRYGHRWNCRHGRTARGPIPRHRTAADYCHHDLHGRGCANHRKLSRNATRTTNERRRQYALHAVDERERWHTDTHRDLRRGHRSQHRSGQRSEPSRAGPAEPAGRR